MNGRQKRSLTGNLRTLVQDGEFADELVIELIEQLRAARTEQEFQARLTVLAEQLLNELEG